MKDLTDTFEAVCACGRTAYVGHGRPLATLACYCDDCQAAAAQIDAMPDGRSGLRSDGGTVSAFFRKDRVHVARGSDLIQVHSLRQTSPTMRCIATCCHSNMATRFDNWYPIVALRTYAPGASLTAERCMSTKFAPDATKLIDGVPHHRGVAPGFALRLLLAAVQLRLGG